MRNLRTLILTACVSATSLLWASSCDSVDAAFDCQSVCERYQSCFNKDYDVGKCRSDCRTKSANDSTIRAKADACDACIDDMSCAAATFNCSQDCLAIVP